MTNEEIYTKMMSVGETMDQLFKENRLAERNALVPRWRALYQAYDWGFTEGQDLFIWRGKRLAPGKLIECLPENQFLVRFETGGEMIVPGFLLKHEGPKEPEQISLFDEVL